MSYRSFKRVLGETSLEWKCRWLFGACLLLLITGSFWWYGNRTDQLVYEQNRRVGRGLVNVAMAELHWHVLETNVGYRDFVKSLAENMRNQDYTWRTINPDNSKETGQPRDEMEWELLDRWKQAGVTPTSPDELSQIFDERHLPENNEYRYYQPIYAKRDCIECHRIIDANPQLQEGDMMGIVQVSVSDKEIVRAQNKNRAFLLVTAIITTFLAMVALYAIVRYVIVKPLKHLRDVSNEIRRGNVALRAEINTGDEFEEVAAAFNRMLRHLVRTQEKLRDLNTDLDAKVDELAQMNMRLYELNRLKSDFLATVSHELRTPLNSIIGFSDVLESTAAFDEKPKRYVQNIQRSGRMLLDMINDILDLAKIESGKMEVRPTEFEIEHVIAQQCDMARPLAERKNIDLEYQVPDGLPPLTQDQGKVQQILSNLVSNAIKFTPDGGQITISASRDESGNMLLTVRDTGVGIAEEDQKVIFEKFRQGSSVLSGGDAMTREYSGTGLGLSIVRELCRLLGGEISVSSQLGQGSTFTARLPWVLKPEPRPAKPIDEELDEMTRPRQLGLQSDDDGVDSPTTDSLPTAT